MIHVVRRESSHLWSKGANLAILFSGFAVFVRNVEASVEGAYATSKYNLLSSCCAGLSSAAVLACTHADVTQVKFKALSVGLVCFRGAVATRTQDSRFDDMAVLRSRQPSLF